MLLLVLPMKFSVRLVPNFKKVDADGFSPIRICITVKRKRTYKSTGKKVKKKDWSEETNLIKQTVQGAAVINTILKNKVAAIEKKMHAMDLQEEAFSITRIRRRISDKPLSDDFAKFWKDLTPDLKKQLGEETFNNFQTTVDRITAFHPGLHFSDIDVKWLRKYETHLIDAEFANNTIHKHWKHLINIFNRARAEGVTTNYPFDKYENPKYVQTIRTFLLIEEVELIEQAMKKPLKEYHIVTGHYFLLGFYSGLRYSDWARFNEGFVQGSRLLLGTKKTGEIISMEMHERLKRVVEKVLTLPPIYSEHVTNSFLKTLAVIAGISKNLTTHVARHSYATHCLRKKVPDDVIAQTMGITKKTLQIYKHLLDSSVDEEMIRAWDT